MPRKSQFLHLIPPENETLTTVCFFMFFRSINIYFWWQKAFCEVSGAEIEYRKPLLPTILLNTARHLSPSGNTHSIIQDKITNLFKDGDPHTLGTYGHSSLRKLNCRENVLGSHGTGGGGECIWGLWKFCLRAKCGTWHAHLSTYFRVHTFVWWLRTIVWCYRTSDQSVYHTMSKDKTDGFAPIDIVRCAGKKRTPQ